MANECFNNMLLLKEKQGLTPFQIFGKTKVNINPKHFKPFGCPVFILENSLQSNSPYHKWKERSKVVIYHGPSPKNGRNVALVLNRTTGLVSPQFHVKFDPLFRTVKQGELEY